MKWTLEETIAWFNEEQKRLGITQTEFADRVGIARSDFSRYKNRIQEPRAAMVKKIADAVGINVIEAMVALGMIDPADDKTPKIALGKRYAMAKRLKK